MRYCKDGVIYMEKIKPDTPLMMLTVSQFQALVESCFNTNQEQPVSPQSPQKHYVYGLKGLCELFDCAHSTAQYLKDNVITAAVSQNGRKIVVDADFAMQLFHNHKFKKA